MESVLIYVGLVEYALQRALYQGRKQQRVNGFCVHVAGSKEANAYWKSDRLEDLWN